MVKGKTLFYTTRVNNFTEAIHVYYATDGYLRAVIETTVAKLGYRIGLTLADGLLLPTAFGYEQIKCCR